MKLFSVSRIAVAFLFASLMAVVSLAQTAEPEWTGRFDDLIAKGMKDTHTPGLAIGVVIDGKLVYSRGFGQATIGQPGIPVTADTVFHMASITKPFVATAIMQLVEQGKVSLDEPLIKYLPYFRLNDDRYRAITIRQMLNHTSGMPDVEDYEWDKPQYDDAALERWVRSLKNRKLLWEPGSRYRYSNIAFEVLADVIAKVSGTSFEDYIEKYILIPVGMKSSTLLKEKTDPAKLAAGYTVQKNGLPKPIRAYPYNRRHNASSDLMSSVNDMARWAIVNINRGEIEGKRILKDSAYDLLWKPSAEAENCENGPCRKTGKSVGISWFLETKDGHLTVGHSGGDDGFLTYMLLVPDRKLGMVVMTNSDTASIPLIRQLATETFTLAK